MLTRFSSYHPLNSHLKKFTHKIMGQKSTNQHQVPSNLRKFMSKSMPNLPGYFWDEQRQRYFKIDKNSKPTQEFFKPEPKVEKFDITNVLFSIYSRQSHPKNNRSIELLQFDRSIPQKHEIIGKFVHVMGEYVFSSSGSHFCMSMYHIARDGQGLRPVMLADFRLDISSVKYLPNTQSFYISTWSGEILSTKVTLNSQLPLLDQEQIGLDFESIESQDVENPSSIYCMDVNEKYLVYGGDKRLYYVDQETRQKTKMKNSSDVLSMILKDDIVFNGDRNGNVVVYDLKNQKEMKKFVFNQGIVSILLHDDFYVIASTFGGQIARFDIRNEKTPVIEYQGHVNSCTSNLQLYATQKYLFSGDDDKNVRIWDVSSGDHLQMSKFDDIVYSISPYKKGYLFGCENVVIGHDFNKL